MKHPVIQNQALVDKVVSRLGQLYAFEKVVAAEANFVVVDMMHSSIEADPRCADMILGINQLATTVRDARGKVA